MRANNDDRVHLSYRFHKIDWALIFELNDYTGTITIRLLIDFYLNGEIQQQTIEINAYY